MLNYTAYMTYQATYEAKSNEELARLAKGRDIMTANILRVRRDWAHIATVSREHKARRIHGRVQPGWTDTDAPTVTLDPPPPSRALSPRDERKARARAGLVAVADERKSNPQPNWRDDPVGHCYWAQREGRRQAEERKFKLNLM